MSEWFLLALAVLATFRLAQFVVYDEGPWSFMFRLRQRGGAYEYGESGEPVTRLGRLLNCPYCSGMWIAGAVAGGLYWQRPLWIPLVWLAIAGGQAFLQGMVARR